MDSLSVGTASANSDKQSTLSEWIFSSWDCDYSPYQKHSLFPQESRPFHLLRYRIITVHNRSIRFDALNDFHLKIDSLTSGGIKGFSLLQEQRELKIHSESALCLSELAEAVPAEREPISFEERVINLRYILLRSLYQLRRL